MQSPLITHNSKSKTKGKKYTKSMENMATVLFVRQVPSCGGAASAQHSAAHAKTDPFFSMAQLDQFLGAETWLAQVVVGDEE